MMERGRGRQDGVQPDGTSCVFKLRFTFKSVAEAGTKGHKGWCGETCGLTHHNRVLFDFSRNRQSTERRDGRSPGLAALAAFPWETATNPVTTDLRSTVKSCALLPAGGPVLDILSKVFASYQKLHEQFPRPALGET